MRGHIDKWFPYKMIEAKRRKDNRHLIQFARQLNKKRLLIFALQYRDIRILIASEYLYGPVINNTIRTTVYIKWRRHMRKGVVGRLKPRIFCTEKVIELNSNSDNGKFWIINLISILQLHETKSTMAINIYICCNYLVGHYDACY